MATTLIERFRRARADPALAVLEGFHALKHAVRFGATIELRLRAAGSTTRGAGAAAGAGSRPLARASPHPGRSRGLRRASRRRRRRPAFSRSRAGRRSIPPGCSPRRAPRRSCCWRTRAGPAISAWLVRAAAAAEVAAVLTTGRLEPWQPAALRGSAGLHYALPVARLDEVPQTPRPLLAIDPAGEPLRLGAVPSGAVLAFGVRASGPRPRASRARRAPSRDPDACRRLQPQSRDGGRDHALRLAPDAAMNNGKRLCINRKYGTPLFVADWCRRRC